MLLQDNDLKAKMKMFKKGFNGYGAVNSSVDQSIDKSVDKFRDRQVAQSARDLHSSTSNPIVDNYQGEKRLTQGSQPDASYKALVDQRSSLVGGKMHAFEVQDDFIHMSMQVSSIGDDNSICSSRRSLGFGAVQSMDGRRNKSKKKQSA